MLSEHKGIRNHSIKDIYKAESVTVGAAVSRALADCQRKGRKQWS